MKSTLTLPASGKASAGTVRRWLKQPADPVRAGDVLLELETDGGLVEIDAPIAGTLEQILVPPGKSVAPGAALGLIADQTSTESTPPAAAAPPSPSPDRKPMKPPASQQSGKVTPILMPQAGQSMEEGTLVTWRVAVGDRVAKGDVIFEIDTDKATMEVEATDSGRLARIVLPEGGTLKVLEPVAYLAETDADVDAFLQGSGGGAAAAPSQESTRKLGAPLTTPASSEAASATEPPAPRTATGRVKASPAARRLASERGIDLAAVAAGSGPHGRILSTDIPAGSPGAASIRPTGLTSHVPPSSRPASATPGAVKRRQMSSMRKAIGRALTLSKQTVPHFYVKLTLNADPLFSLYQAEKAKYPCSLNDVVVLGCARAISEFPAFRSRIEGEEIVELPSSNIGLAVGMDDGLVVPVLIAAETMTLRQIGAETKRLATAARSGKIEGMGQGVFTITNLGMFGVEEFSAIINPPESAILAVGAVREAVTVSGGALRAGRVMTVVLSADHRIIDGALAAKFMVRLKELMESPQTLL